MKLESLNRREVTTRLGVLPLWTSPDAFSGSRPLVLGIQGLFAGDDDLAGLPGVVARFADVALVRTPRLGRLIGDGSVEAFAEALGDLIGQLFPARPVVLLGVSLGATAALAVRAPSLRRVVAVEPLLATADLWPIVAPIREQLAAAPRDTAIRDTFWRYFGIGPKTTAPRDYRRLLAALSVPADVVLGSEPLEPRRKLARFPSLVGAAERAALASRGQVRLHVADGAGHNVQAQAPSVLREVLLEACRRAAAEPVYDPRAVDEPLVEATPLTAGRVLHWGPAGEAFAGAYLSWNPAAQISALGEAADAAPEPEDAAACDALVLGAAPPPGLLERLVPRLAPGGQLVARWTSAEAASATVRDRLQALGLELGAPLDGAGTGVLRARKAAPDAPAQAPLRVEMVAFAPYLMDVRTRLPTRGLRSDPELIVDYAAPPYSPPELPYDAPKVVILQRPGALPYEQILRQLAYPMARGWIVALEYDDHPALTAEAVGREFDPAELALFAAAHAVQTTTEPLAALFRTANPEVRIFENTVFELAPFPRAERPRRVFYGAISRGAFGVEVARSLRPVVEAFPDLEFVVLGDEAVFAALPTANKRFESYLGYEAYLARMAECQISLSPIEPLPLRETKSDAKFLDAARAGVLTIASPLIYDRVIRHGENGLLARGLEDWAPLLQQALARPDQTRAMARAAWDYVRRERMFASQVPERRAWYQELWARREALYAAALARVPGLAEAQAAERAGLGR